MTAPGYLALVLHAHLPYVRHPEHERFVEEQWLFDALSESYLPLLRALRTLQREGVPFELTISVSPTLVTMLGDELLERRYVRHLAELRRLLLREARRTRSDATLARLTRYHLQRLDLVEHTLQELGGDIVAALAQLQRAGHLDLLTTGATHGYLPLLAQHPAAVWAQIAVARDHHRSEFGVAPSGIWLPECGYAPGIDRLVARADLGYFVAESHAVLLGRPRPQHGIRAPIRCADSGVAVFARDVASSVEVWSPAEGYPTDPAYREYHRDIGYELSAAQLGDYFGDPNRKIRTGITYHRVTGRARDKQPYDPAAAERTAHHHARDFVARRAAQLARERRSTPHAVTVCAYDAELFGHWWHEGVSWLTHVIRQAAARPELQLCHLRRYLTEHPEHQRSRPVESSWGEGGCHATWLDPSNSWIYPGLHCAAEQMVGLATRYPAPTPTERRALQQAARELLLAQSSDWAFIIRRGTLASYAERRTREHLERFFALREQLSDHALDDRQLAELAWRSPIFAELDHRVYADPPV